MVHKENDSSPHVLQNVRRDALRSPEPATIKQKITWGIAWGVIFGATAAGIIVLGPVAALPLAVKAGLETGAVAVGFGTGVGIRSDAGRQLHFLGFGRRSAR